MTLLTAIEIATNYPDNILINAKQDSETNKWSSFMYMIRNGDIHKLMLSFDNFPFVSEDEAITNMNGIVELAIKHVNDKTV